MTDRIIHKTAGPVRMVSVEATERMIDAAGEEHSLCYSLEPGEGLDCDPAEPIYAAMLAAAPTDPQADVVALYRAMRGLEMQVRRAHVHVGFEPDDPCAICAELNSARAMLAKFTLEEDDA